MEPITFFNCFEVATGQEDVFIDIWTRKSLPHFSSKPGFNGYRMYRAHTMPGRFAFVNQVWWESAAHLQAAHDEKFDKLLKDPELPEFKANPGVFGLYSESKGAALLNES